MTPIQQKILTILCVATMATGIVIGIFQAMIWLNQWWSYPFGFGLSVLVILGAFEIVERSQER